VTPPKWQASTGEEILSQSVERYIQTSSWEGSLLSDTELFLEPENKEPEDNLPHCLDEKQPWEAVMERRRV
jgi:hypothetical protein